MRSNAITVTDYLKEIPKERASVFRALRTAVKRNLPNGFRETMTYGMITYVIPHSLYPDGYHVNPQHALPFMSLASQKDFIAVYHMGIYADRTLLAWFTAEYTKLGIGKMDMGKSCIRFRNPAKMPVALIGALAAKITPQEWITRYEHMRPR